MSTRGKKRTNSLRAADEEHAARARVRLRQHHTLDLSEGVVFDVSSHVLLAPAWNRVCVRSDETLGGEEQMRRVVTREESA